jgi:hypothetical protein
MPDPPDHPLARTIPDIYPLAPDDLAWLFAHLLAGTTWVASDNDYPGNEFLIHVLERAPHQTHLTYRYADETCVAAITEEGAVDDFYGFTLTQTTIDTWLLAILEERWIPPSPARP